MSGPVGAPEAHVFASETSASKSHVLEEQAAQKAGSPGAPVPASGTPAQDQVVTRSAPALTAWYVIFTSLLGLHTLTM